MVATAGMSRAIPFLRVRWGFSGFWDLSLGCWAGGRAGHFQSIGSLLRRHSSWALVFSETCLLPTAVQKKGKSLTEASVFISLPPHTHTYLPDLELHCP